MLARLLAAAVVALGVSSAHAQSADPNLQNLLTGLTNGGEVRLITPLTTGMLQVTSFRVPVRMTAAEAAAYVDRARQELWTLGVAQPSAEQIARMLAGGPLDTPTGRFTMPGLLTLSGIQATLVSQIVNAGTPASGYGSSAAGGSAPAAPVQAREAALRELAALGILNPSEDQIRTALVGGTITTVNGVVQLPGLLPR
jgi:hypothetical protein